MADVAISDLTAVTTAAGTDQFEVNQGGTSKRETLTQVGDYVRDTYLADGWIDPNETWTYATATTFTVSGDQTAKLSAGTRLKLTQTTTKYFDVATSAEAGGTTTVTIIDNADYTLTNAAITSPYYSYAANPQGWPGWLAWTPTFTGFSADPGTPVAEYRTSGNMLFFNLYVASAGTSNATTFTITAPVAAQTATNAMWSGAVGYALDNSAALTGGARWLIQSGDTAFTLRSDFGSGAWTNSNTKSAEFQGFYRF